MLKDIATGALITSLIFIVSAYIPIVGFFGALFIPLPTLYYRSKLGRTSGAIIPVASFVLMLVTMGKFSLDVLVLAELLAVGFVLGELIEVNFSIEKTFLCVCGSILIIGAAGLLIFSSTSPKGIYAIISQYVAQNLEITLALYQNMGMSEENIRVISSYLDKIQYVLVRIIPALVVSSTLFITWTSLLLVKPFLKRRQLFFPDYGRLSLWKASELLVWGAIGCGLMLLFPDNGIKMIGLNGLIILMTIYFFQGIAIVSYYFEKKHFPRILRFFLYALIALQQMLIFLIIGLGFFDVWLNFRKLGIQKK